MNELTIQEKDQAMERSANWLAEHLNEFESFCVDIWGFLPVIDSDGDHWYINPFARVQSTYNLSKDKWYCITVQDDQIPVGDVALGIKLMLETDVKSFYDSALEMKAKPPITEALVDFTDYFSLNKDVGYEFNTNGCCSNDDEVEPSWEGLCDYHKGYTRAMQATAIAMNEFYSDKEVQSFQTRQIRDIASTYIHIFDMREEFYERKERPILNEYVFSILKDFKIANDNNYPRAKILMDIIRASLRTQTVPKDKTA